MPDSISPISTDVRLASSTRNHTGAILMIVAFIVLIAIVGSAYYFFVIKKANSGPGVYASVSIFPASQLYKLNTLGNTLNVVTAPGQTKGTIVIDEVQNATTTYYLITNAAQTNSNIYSSTNGASVVQLTDTPTFKYDLSFDPTSGYFTYVSGAVQNPQQLWEGNREGQFAVTLAMLGANGKILSQSIITTGASAAVLVPKANTVIVKKSDGLYGYSLFGNTSLKIQSVASTTILGETSDGQLIPPNLNAPAMPFAVSSTGMVAIYNPVSGEIDIYNASSGLNGLTYVSSQKVSFTPTAIAFDGNQLVLAQNSIGTKRFSSIFSIPGVKGLPLFTNVDQTQQSAVPQHIIYE